MVYRKLFLLFLIFIIPFSLKAQLYEGWQVYAGDTTLSIATGVSTSAELNNTAGSLEVAAGYFISDSFEFMLRYGRGFVGPGRNSETPDSIRIGLDYHFGTVRLYPFVGVNLGYLYSNKTENSLFWSPEVGFKFFLNSHWYLHGLLEANILFEDDRSDDDFYSRNRRVLAILGIGRKW